MLLRSSSTPLFGTHSPFPDSPNRDCDVINNTRKLSFAHGPQHHLNWAPFSFSRSSQLSEELNQGTSSFSLKGFRRAWSDGNLERLASKSFDKEEFLDSTTPKKFSDRQNKQMLHTAASLSIFNTSDGLQDEEKNEGDAGSGEVLTRTVAIGDRIEAVGSEDFSFGKKNMSLIEEDGEEEKEEDLNGVYIHEQKEPISPPLYLAAGLGIDGYDFGADSDSRGGRGDVDLSLPNFDEGVDTEEYYERMLEKYPLHPLFLTNYAQLLQSKGDVHGAEEYYHQATLADPDDGEILLQYAKLVWELHHDQDRALSYFERAVQATPQDSRVLAAYASFLWELDTDGGEDISLRKHIQVEEGRLNKLDNSATDQELEPLQLPSGLRIDGRDDAASEVGNVEEYYERMVKENPCNSLVLRNYAQFLCQSKGDLQGAKEYYSRAILADPGDGEIISQYAKLVWDLQGDHNKASGYFERAVQATPENSHVLAAYASFLWEIEENEDSTMLPIQHESAAMPQTLETSTR